MIDLVVNPDEAPIGYYAIKKPDIYFGNTFNICSQCDFRKTCCSKELDIFAYGQKCMDGESFSEDGRVSKRNDGCSVLFKLKK